MVKKNSKKNIYILREKKRESDKYLKVAAKGWLAHLVSQFACNARVIVDASSDTPVSHVKSL